MSQINETRSVGPYGSIAVRADNFAYCLELAISDGERIGDGDLGLDAETHVAIAAVAAEFPDASAAAVAAAHEAFARDIRGIHYNESHAVFMACRDGVIPQVEQAPTPECEASPRLKYGPHLIGPVEPDPAAARAWILAASTRPSSIGVAC
jgi:hypothetical protein